MPQTEPMPDVEVAQHGRALIHRLVEQVWNQHDLQALSDVYADDVIVEGLSDEPAEGLQNVRLILQGLNEAFPDMQYTVLDVLSEGDRVAVRWSARGTHQGDFMGIPATRRNANCSGISIFRLHQGKIVHAWIAANMMELLQHIWD